jgi:hypothetical protein
MRGSSFTIAIFGSLLFTACDDGASPPGGDDRTAAEFEQLADSMADGGDYARAEALRHAAMIVRLTGDPTPVTLTIDGQSRPFVAVTEELEYPNIVCHWPVDSGIVFPDSGGTMPPDTASSGPGSCESVGSMRIRTLIAWEPERLAEVVRLVALDGRGFVAPAVPDAMAGTSHQGESWGGGVGTPTDPAMPPQPDDSAVGSPPVNVDPGFMAEYLERDQGFWISVSGSQANTLEQEGGACRLEEVEFDWARFACQSIQARFEFTMRVQKLGPILIDPMDLPGNPSMPPAEWRDISLAPTSIAGARLSLLEWLPPPLEPPTPGPMPVPSDSGSSSPGMPGGG